MLVKCKITRCNWSLFANVVLQSETLPAESDNPVYQQQGAPKLEPAISKPVLAGYWSASAARSQPASAHFPSPLPRGCPCSQTCTMYIHFGFNFVFSVFTTLSSNCKCWSLATFFFPWFQTALLSNLSLIDQPWCETSNRRRSRLSRNLPKTKSHPRNPGKTANLTQPHDHLVKMTQNNKV